MINDVLASFAYPELPFGGIKDSGVGRNHGVQGLLALTQTRVVSENRALLSRDIWWHPYDRKVAGLLMKNLGRMATLLDSLPVF